MSFHVAHRDSISVFHHFAMLLVTFDYHDNHLQCSSSC